MERAADLAGEDDLAVGRGLDLGARRGGVVQTAVAGTVLGGWRPKRVGDRCGNRRLIAACARSGRGGARGCNNEEGDDAESQNGEAHLGSPAVRTTSGGSAA